MVRLPANVTHDQLLDFVLTEDLRNGQQLRSHVQQPIVLWYNGGNHFENFAFVSILILLQVLIFL